MKRTIACLLTLAIPCAWGCGGKVVVDGAPDTLSSGTGGASGSSTGAGGCDAKSHTIDIADFNVSCLVAADCIAVFAGDFCGTCKCPFSAINASDELKYQEEQQMKSVGTPPGGCFCPAMVPACVQSQCTTQTP